MKAIFNKVIVEKVHEAQKSASGVYLGNQDTEKFAKGKVISVGEKVENIEVGEIAWYDKHRCSEIKLNGKVFDIMDNSNIFVVE